MLVFCSILLSVCCVQDEEKKASPFKIEYESEGGGFEIRFPSKPETQTIKLNGKEFQGVFTSDGERVASALVAFSEYPAGFVAKTGHKKIFDSIITDLFGKEAEFDNRRPFAQGKMVGEEIELRVAPNGFRLRYFVLGDRFFLLWLATKHVHAGEKLKEIALEDRRELANAFFDSFELTQLSKSEVEAKLKQVRARLAELKSAAPKERTWKLRNGGLSFSASFVESKEYRIVTLKKTSGEIINLERKLLCHEDLVYLAELNKSEKPRVQELRRLESQLSEGLDALKRLKEEFKTSNSIGMKFKHLKSGTFTMGEGKTARQVTLTKSFQMGIHEVTQEQYQKVMGKNPSQFKGDQNPVEQVSWNDAVEFCRKLSELPAEKEAGNAYRLPTVAEWEYACRAGTTTKFSFGDDESRLGEFTWYRYNSDRKPHPVGQKKPNDWGLYDMYGNVWEWCQDRHGNNKSNAPVTDPTGPRSGSHRVARGGGWGGPVSYFWHSSRHPAGPTHKGNYLGFRVVRRALGKTSPVSK